MSTRPSPRKSRTFRATRLAAIASIVISTGCGPILVKHPDAPMLILDAKGRVKVAVEDETGQLIEFGWVKMQPGWTIVTDYDWSVAP